MTDLVAELSAQAQSLPPEDRARLAEALLASLDPAEPDGDAAWSDELRRRIADLETGAVEGIPADQAVHRVLAQRQQ